MKTSHYIGIVLLLGICLSCDKDNELTQEQEAENLSELFAEIESLASMEACTDASVWSFTSYGHKACGGPVGFIAYSTTIDTVLFLEKIETHRAAQQEFNIKWGIISDCAIPAQPSGVVCENGKPVFEY